MTGGHRFWQAVFSPVPHGLIHAAPNECMCLCSCVNSTTHAPMLLMNTLKQG